jgi:hypothetical protein
MVFKRFFGWLASPLPLAGEADALEERGGWGSLHEGNPDAVFNRNDPRQIRPA